MAGKTLRWLITGVSSGLGRALALKALGRGDSVIGTVRKGGQGEEFAAIAPGRAHPLVLDVTDDAAPDAAARAVAKLGGVDVLVNNAGYALIGAVEDVSLDEARLEMETNFFGPLKMIRALTPVFRQQGSGRIINIASVAGAAGIPIYGLYCASKFAVVGLSAALAKELKPFGIFVSAVEPGGFRTNFGGTSLKVAEAMSPPYEELTRGMATRMASFGKVAANDPEKGAAALIALAEMAEPPVHVAIGADGLGHVTGAAKARLADYERASVVLPDTKAD